MSGWLFSIGRVHETTVAAPLGAGAGVCTLPSASTLFSAGDLVFASPSPASGSAPASQVQWLGRVTAATTSTLTVSLPPRAALAGGFHLWRAAAWVDLPVSGEWHGTSTLAAGVFQAVSLGGQFWSQQLGPALQRAELRLERIPQLRYAQFAAWFAGAAGSGALPFVLVSPEQQLRLCRLAPATATADPHGRLATSTAAQPGGFTQLTLPLYILATEQYA